MSVSCQQETRAAQQTATSFDHLVGAAEQCGQHGEAECLRCLEIDDQFEFGRLLDRQVGRSGTLEDAIKIRGRAKVKISQINSVGNEAPGRNEQTERIDCGQPVLGRQCDNQITMSKVEDVGKYDEACIPVAAKRGYGAFNACRILNG